MAPRHECQRAVSETHEYDARKQQLKIRGQVYDVVAGLTNTTILRTQFLGFHSVISGKLQTITQVKNASVVTTSRLSSNVVCHSTHSKSLPSDGPSSKNRQITCGIHLHRRGAFCDHFRIHLKALQCNAHMSFKLVDAVQTCFALPQLRRSTVPVIDTLLKSASLSTACARNRHQDNIGARIFNLKTITKLSTCLPAAHPRSIGPLAQQMYQKLHGIMLHVWPAPPRKQRPPRKHVEYAVFTRKAQALQSDQRTQERIGTCSSVWWLRRKQPAPTCKHHRVHITMVSGILKPQRLPSQVDSRSTAGERFSRCGRILTAPRAQAWRSTQAVKMR